MSEQELSPELEAALKDFRKKIADYQSANHADSADLAALDPSSLTVTDMELWNKLASLFGQADTVVSSPEVAHEIFIKTDEFVKTVRAAKNEGANTSFANFVQNAVMPLYSYSTDYDWLMASLVEFNKYLQEKKDKMGIK